MATAAALYLLGTTPAWVKLPLTLLYPVLLGVCMPITPWIYPYLEIAPEGRSRLSRLKKAGLSVLGTLALGVVAKAIYGG